MKPDLTDEETAALVAELDHIIENDRYPFSPRIRTFREIRAKMKPYPVREPQPPTRHYELPRATVRRRRRAGG
jgi:hypothetical protein